MLQAKCWEPGSLQPEFNHFFGFHSSLVCTDIIKCGHPNVYKPARLTICKTQQNYQQKTAILSSYPNEVEYERAVGYSMKLTCTGLNRVKSGQDWLKMPPPHWWQVFNIEPISGTGRLPLQIWRGCRGSERQVYHRYTNNVNNEYIIDIAFIIYHRYIKYIIDIQIIKTKNMRRIYTKGLGVTGIPEYMNDLKNQLGDATLFLKSSYENHCIMYWGKFNSKENTKNSSNMSPAKLIANMKRLKGFLALEKRSLQRAELRCLFQISFVNDYFLFVT